MWTYNDDDEYIVYCYDPSQDKWTTLPPLSIRWFGLGQVDGKLVTVGGKRKGEHLATNEVYTYEQRSRKWKRTIPPMPTAKCCIIVLSLQSALVAVGGHTMLSFKDTVELFKSDTSQWYRTDPLPMACYDITPAAIGNTCYALGGYKSRYLNQALYASVDDLLRNAIPANKTTHSGNSDTQSAWKTLPDTPVYGPTAAVLAGNLLAIGGSHLNSKLNQLSRRKSTSTLPPPTPGSTSVIYLLLDQTLQLLLCRQLKLW